MAYIVNKFNGTAVASVEDGSVDKSTDVTFVGRNYAGYGEVQNENFLALMEHFANTSQPPRPVTGQIWYNSETKKLNVCYDEVGKQFKVVSGAAFGATAPTDSAIGDLWWNTTSAQLFAYSSTGYRLVGPEISNRSAVTAQIVTDTAVPPLQHTIVKVTANEKVVLIINEDEEFNLSSDVDQDLRDAFPVVKKGVTLANTAMEGTYAGMSTDNWTYWGTASNADRLGGLSVNDFIRKDLPKFTIEMWFSDAGFVVGDDKDLRINVTNNDNVNIENLKGNPIRFKIADSTAANGVLLISTDSVSPGASTDTTTLGTSSKQWYKLYAKTIEANTISGDITGKHTGDVYSTATNSTKILDAATSTFYGSVGTLLNPSTIYGSVTGNLDGSITGSSSDSAKLAGLSPSLSHVANTQTVVLRDTTGNVTATTFTGTATQANTLRLISGNPAVTTYISASIASTANTIAVRDSNNQIAATTFYGKATQAQYADLAEKYLTDKDYPVGTVVIVGGDQEVTECRWGEHAIGVVSSQPAFKMNCDLEGGTYIALKGRVPVKVVGAVSKGDKLMAGHTGYAVVQGPQISGHVFAIALESNSDTGGKLIEAVVL